MRPRTSDSSRLGEFNGLAMLPKKPRGSTCFVTPLPTCTRTSTVASCPRRRPTTCVATKLLVIDLQALLHAAGSDFVPLSERVMVDRNSSQDTTYLLYMTQANYIQSMEAIRASGLVEPDALAALDGSELYQRQYRTPDPYWAKMVRKDWDAKPAAWVVEKFFAEELEPARNDVGGNEEYELMYVPKDDATAENISERVQTKLREMGVKARVRERGERVVVTPAVGSPAEVVGFCQMMLRIPEEATYVFGGQRLLSNCVEGRRNWGICEREGREWGSGMDRVYVSEKDGVEAIVDGVLHHAIF